MTDPTFYAATYRFRSPPLREAVILLEAVHPVVYALAHPGSLGADRSPVLLHWAIIPLDEATGIWEAYGAAGRQDDIVSLDGLRAELLAVEADYDKPALATYREDVRLKLQAIQSYADGIGHVFEEPAVPAP